MTEGLCTCPFCGNDRIKVYVDKIKDKEHVFTGSEFAFTRCHYCGAQGPYFYVVDLNEEKISDYAYKLWNERREISFSKELMQVWNERK